MLVENRLRFSSFIFHSSFFIFHSSFAELPRLWSVWMDSNHRPHAYQACALTTWATNRFLHSLGIGSNHLLPRFGSRHCRVVEMMGFEPMTPCLQGRCSPSWATPPYLRVCSFSMISNNRQVVFDPWKLNNKSSIQASLKTSLVNRLRDLREKISWSP